MTDPDITWFALRPDRMSHIRPVRFGEAEIEFQTLGDHESSRRRMIIVRVPDGIHEGALMWIPFLQFGDEEVEDSDHILMPIVHQLMMEARGGIH